MDKNKYYYQFFLGIVKNFIPVYHRKIIDCSGYFCSNRFIIIISSELQNTLVGIRVLLHEFFHYIDMIGGKFGKFYKCDKMKYSARNWKMVINAEKSASYNAKKFAKLFGLELSFEELDGRIRLMYGFYRRNYFYN